MDIVAGDKLDFEENAFVNTRSVEQLRRPYHNTPMEANYKAEGNIKIRLMIWLTLTHHRFPHTMAIQYVRYRKD